ncbi:MAG: hypothetical protein IKF91_00620 [Bacilli bacterium]|nr:hypothetical protein [Bacilli bacterium]
MKKKGMVCFVILFSIIFSLYVSIKYVNRNKSVNLSEEFSIEKNQVVRITNSDHTSIKLLSINVVDCTSSSCSDEKSLNYNLFINGQIVTITEIPSSIKIYENGELKVVEGDEDRLILKVVED